VDEDHVLHRGLLELSTNSPRWGVETAVPVSTPR
jgi:hypothetical protein